MRLCLNLSAWGCRKKRKRRNTRWGGPHEQDEEEVQSEGLQKEKDEGFGVTVGRRRSRLGDLWSLERGEEEVPGAGGGTQFGAPHEQ